MVAIDGVLRIHRAFRSLDAAVADMATSPKVLDCSKSTIVVQAAIESDKHGAVAWCSA